jgi:hypothetical protein
MRSNTASQTPAGYNESNKDPCTARHRCWRTALHAMKAVLTKSLNGTRQRISSYPGDTINTSCWQYTQQYNHLHLTAPRHCLLEVLPLSSHCSLYSFHSGHVFQLLVTPHSLLEVLLLYSLCCSVLLSFGPLWSSSQPLTLPTCSER